MIGYYDWDSSFFLLSSSFLSFFSGAGNGQLGWWDGFAHKIPPKSRIWNMVLKLKLKNFPALLAVDPTPLFCFQFVEGRNVRNSAISLYRSREPCRECDNHGVYLHKNFNPLGLSDVLSAVKNNNFVNIYRTTSSFYMS